MLEYASNGHYYWSKEDMRNYAEQAAERNHISLQKEIKRLQLGEPQSVDDYFQQVQDNLREGQIRLVFFMEEAPAELKSLVEFLNKQMERSEVLLVEARQYEHNGMKVITPILFGYTEEARQVKKTVSVTTGQKKQWDKESFFRDARERLKNEEVNSIKELLDKSQELKCELTWGNGKTAGSFSPKWLHIGKYAIFSVYSDGKLTINFGSFQNNPEHPEFLHYLKDKVVVNLGLAIPEDYERRYPNYKIEDWSKKIKDLIKVLERILEDYPAPRTV